MAGVPLFMFLPHFDITCDLLLNRITATWNIFVKLTILLKKKPPWEKIDSLKQSHLENTVYPRKICLLIGLKSCFY